MSSVFTELTAEKTELIASRGTSAVAADNEFFAADFNQSDGFFFAWLETNGGSGRDVEAHVEGGFAIEMQRRIHFVKREVAADLNGPVAGVGNIDERGAASRIKFDFARLGDDFARLGDDFAGFHGFDLKFNLGFSPGFNLESVGER